ncbi:hypothetical protein GCM10009734_25170 [Nonomuraea bangladeshensis]
MWQERPLAFAYAGDPLTAQYPHADNDTIGGYCGHSRWRWRAKAGIPETGKYPSS